MSKRLSTICVVISVGLIVIFLAVFYIPKSQAAQPTVSWGSRGSGVIVLQRKLRNWGYYSGSIDGTFGSETYRAVVNFQRKNRLRVDGVVGAETWAALGYEGSGGSSQTSRVSGSAGVSRSNNVEMIARLVHAEARGEPYEGQVAVAAILLNRVDSPSFPNTISGVIYQPLAFESVANGQFNLAPNNDNIRAARSAINGWDPTHGSLFFWNPSKPVNQWIWSRQIVRRIGSHVFAR
ncbi:spore cortex-lytic enzyme [Halocella sp. SP3-1]|uniref:spore cortex-lytic enzyme n=1 Tax=Halocella sp. SP3-1 TaxID=2382161 RepID=UPI000F75DB90|nr:spore cortex-lytic enzyme [Halocella sp. SP3-1]AZO96223.1 spore cortex-lytic enzyme [Halocella sp. SP3-1]